MRRLGRILLTLTALLVGVAVGAGWYVRHRLRASLAALDGEARLTGLHAPVKVERDSLGVPTLSGGSRLDLARALGYLHAQDRFFQMDLLRRRAAGWWPIGRRACIGCARAHSACSRRPPPRSECCSRPIRPE